MHPLIYIPKYKESLVIVPPYRHGVSGEFRCVLYNEMGGIAHDTGWFGNTIGNQGLGLMTSQDAWNNYFYIGSGSAAPAASDTQMSTFTAASYTVQGLPVEDNGVAPNWEFSTMKTKRFAAGVGTSTIREVGVGYNDTSILGLVARQLVSPAIVKGASQVLDVSYRFKIWPSIVDVASVTSIDGADYNVITRGLGYDRGDSALTRFVPYGVGSTSQGVTDGNLAALSAIFPLGTLLIGAESVTWLSGGVTGTTGYREFETKFGLNQGNIAGGPRCCFQETKLGLKVQSQFNKVSDGSKVPKDGTKEWTPQWRMEWVRH